MNNKANYFIQGRVSSDVRLNVDRLCVKFVPGEVLHISDASINFWVTVDLSVAEQDEYQGTVHPLVGGFVDVDSELGKLFPLTDTVNYPSFRDIKSSMFKMNVSLKGHAVPDEEGGYRLDAEATAHSNSPYAKGEYGGKYAFWLQFDLNNYVQDMEDEE